MHTLDKKWKELLFALSGLGPNFLMVLMGAYYSDAVNPAGLNGNPSGQTIMGNICLVLPLVFPILMIIGKIFDGVIDIPFASISDNLSTKWGRRRPPIAISFIPMVVSFALCWVPVFGSQTSGQLGNTIWFFVWSLVFFASYTMSLIAYYGSLSSVCKNEEQRFRVSAFKSFFDTISYCIAYALVPLILQLVNDKLGWGIDKFVFICLPLMLTMLIPLFMIHEGEKYGYPENKGQVKQEKIKLFNSLSITFKNKIFRRWLIVDCCAFFGLQMFLVSMNALIKGGMGFSGSEMALINTCAFAPVPIMLYLFKKAKAKWGLRITFQTCLLSFGIAIMSFFFASTYVCGTNNKMLQYIISCFGGVMGSWAIGAFFMMPYLIPSQIASVEEKLVSKNHSAMYFAAQAFVTSVVGAISSYGIYDILKNVFFTKDFRFTYASATSTQSAIEVASSSLNVPVSSVYNFGVLIVPFIVMIACLVGFIFAFKMPRNYTPSYIAKELKKDNPTIVIDNIIEDEEIETKKEIVFVLIALSILSGFIFGFIWVYILLKNIAHSLKKKISIIDYLLSTLIPFGSAYVISKYLKLLGVNRNSKTYVISIISSIIFPILPLNIIALSLMQSKLNFVVENND